MKPTEHEGTVAVDAAARAVWAARYPAPEPGFDDLPPLMQNAVREEVLPLVWAALEALPDRTREVKIDIIAQIRALPNEPNAGLSVGALHVQALADRLTLDVLGS